MIEIVYEKEKQKPEGNEGFFRIPNNIRQIGEVNETQKIYIEDYAYTYLCRISSGNSSMEMPIFRKQAMVERQSAPLKKLVILVVPREMAPSITARWEMDLSPGMVTSPFKASVFLNFMDGS